MKHWNRRMGVKITCFVLVPILLGLALAGILGIYYMAEMGGYTRTRQALEQDLRIEQMASDADEMLLSNLNQQTGKLEVPAEKDLLFGANTNLRYRVTDQQNNLLATNAPEGATAPEWQTMLVFRAVRVPSEDSQRYYIECLGLNADAPGEFLFYAAVDPKLEALDAYKVIDAFLDVAYALRYWAFAIVGGCLLLALVCFINLLATASRRPHSDALHPGLLQAMPSDVAVIGFTALFWLGFDAISSSFGWRAGEGFSLVLGLCWLVAGIYAGQWLVVGAVGRLKQGNLLKNTLTWKILAFCGRAVRKLWNRAKFILRNLPMVWRSVLLALCFGLWAFFLWLTALFESGFSVVLLLFALIIMAGLVLDGIQLRVLEKAGKALASGDLTYQVDTAKLASGFKTHGENLNSISLGMSRAVESRLQSERMKAELITNVSHDIKNPLTSIINYADLISQEECGCENHREYSQVLVRKSEHLKRLLEDLVEISKASTGNLEVELLPCDAVTLLSQLAGEFQERCAAAGLTLLVRQPEEPLRILADSRRIWRVFENLMQNACKYSLSGSRVYLSLDKKEGFARFSIRNTSREPLDISPEELMERFVRGDSARSTEGNGLGLSIAQSLTQLQGGRMEVAIDGDLFKVTLLFPVAE